MVKYSGKILICFLLVVAVLTFAGCGVMDGSRLLNQDVATVTPSPSPAPQPKGIGENWESDTWKIQLSEVVLTDSVGAAPYDEKAPEGRTLLLLYFDVTNISESSAYFNCIYFRATVDGESVMQEILSTKVIEGRSVAVGTVESEDTARYYIAYEIDEDWETFEVSYDIGGMNSDKLAEFKFTKDSVTEQE